MKGADLLKVLLALVVVWIHTGNSNLWGLTGWVVPVFFTLSGFFLFGKVFKTDNKIEAVVSWWNRILKLYMVWTFIYLPYAAYGFYLDGLSVWKSAAIWIRNLAFRGENYMSWQLWYLLGMLHAGIIIFFFQKIRAPFWTLCIVALVAFLLPKFVDMGRIPFWGQMRQSGDGITIGLPFMVLGGLIWKLCHGIKGHGKDSVLYKPALALRFFSTHIYLCHMLFAGPILAFSLLPRGLVMWAVSVGLCIASGVIVHNLPKLELMLYGRNY